MRFKEASPPRDHTDRNSVTEAAANWELVLAAMLVKVTAYRITL